MREEQDEAAWALTETGIAQAHETGEWIRQNLGSTFDAAYVSPFLRTRQTADGLGLDVTWQIDDRLREREWGEYTTPGYPAYSPEDYLADLAVCSDLSWKTDFPGAESVLDMVPRVTDFFEDAVEVTPRGRIILVTHGGTIRAFQTLLEQLSLPGRMSADHRLSNCCVVMYRLGWVDTDSLEWSGEVRTAHPVLPGDPETPWQPVDQVADLAS